MNIIIPSKKNIDEVIKNNLPDIRGFKVDKLYYIISNIYSRQFINDDSFDEGVSLCGAILQGAIGKEYKQYMEYLQANKVIVNVSGYKVGESCRKYNLAQLYFGIPEWYEITDFTFKRNLKKNIKKDKSWQYLEKWFAGLNIDFQNAQSCIDTDYKLKSNNPELQEYSLKHPETRKDCKMQYLNNKMMLEYFKNKFYPFRIDESGYRAHTILTRSSKILRNFVTYNGQKLVSVDLKNSQPYLLIYLLKNEFWELEKRDWMLTSQADLSLSSHLILYISSIMLGLSFKTQACKEFQRYEDLVKNGGIYEYFSDKIDKSKYPNMTEREIAKFTMMLCFYSKNGGNSGGMKTAFRKSFPKIYKLISAIKMERHNTLAIILQRIESFLILKVICRHIATEKPNLPIFTIHDSIVTTVGNEGYIKAVIEDEMIKYIGVPPKVEYEYWEPETSLNKIYTMQQRIGIMAA